MPPPPRTDASQQQGRRDLGRGRRSWRACVLGVAGRRSVTARSKIGLSPSILRKTMPGGRVERIKTNFDR